MPPGLEVTVPPPVPLRVTVRLLVGAVLASNVAVQLRSASMVTLPSLQSPSPVQPAKTEPASEVGVSVTTVPSS